MSVINENRMSLIQYDPNDSTIPEEVHEAFECEDLLGFRSHSHRGIEIYIYDKRVKKEYGKQHFDLIRTRMLAHEVGHALMHGPDIQEFPDLEAAMAASEDEKFREVEAELFAMQFTERFLGKNELNSAYALRYIHDELRGDGFSAQEMIKLKNSNRAVHETLASVI
jgi:hypothetical protein